MTIARRGLQVQVKVMGQANAVGPTLILGSYFSNFVCLYQVIVQCACLRFGSCGVSCYHTSFRPGL